MLKRLTIMFVEAEFFPPTPPFHHSEPLQRNNIRIDETLDSSKKTVIARTIKLTRPIKLVSKPKPLADILDWLEEKGWKHKGDGWHAPYSCGVAEQEVSEGRSYSFFGNSRIQLIDEERYGLLNWHEDWIESEYMNL